MKRLSGLLLLSVSVPLGIHAQEAPPSTAVAAPNVPTSLPAASEHRFVLAENYGARFEETLRVTRPGRVRIEARWDGDAENLALILNGPGRENAYARVDGGSALLLEFDVDENLVHLGDDWTLSVVNFSAAQAQGGVGKPARGWVLAMHPPELDWDALKNPLDPTP